MSNEMKCDVCQKMASQKCGGCHTVYYCGREHQKSGWKAHKKQCRPFKVCTDDIVGRHLKATRDIKSNEIILQEPPLIWGPAQSTIPVCLGCCKAITEKNSRPCSKCGWPMCSEICEKAPAHIPECRYTVLRGNQVCIRNFGLVHPSYQCITVLRCLYQKQFLPQIWKKIEALQSHCENRKGTRKYKQDKNEIAKFVLRFFKMEGIFTEDEIMEVCGIVLVNSHEVPLTEPAHIAIYETSSIFEHNCSANCSKSFSDKGAVLISTAKTVKKGGNLSICYTDALWGTASRRAQLQEFKFFWCCCERCTDTTELGTYFSALRCQDSTCNGYLLPKTFLVNDTNEQAYEWLCNKCHLSLAPYIVEDLLDKVKKDLAEMPRDVPMKCRKFIEAYGQLLHPNHYYLTDVKMALVHMIGHEERGLQNVCDEDLEAKALLCRTLAELALVLFPGEKRIRGLLLFELHASLAEMGRRKTTRELCHASLMVSITNFGIVHPNYQCITVLRCLYQKQFLPLVWKKIETLQSHCEERKGTQKYQRERNIIANFILRFFKMEAVFTEDEIMKVCGIVMVNSHEVPLTEPPHIAIYETTSMFEHNCSANCSKTFTDTGGVLIVTGKAVKKGDYLSICYTDPLWGTQNRRLHLEESKFFWCSCERCADTTEFGTYFSALKCQDSTCKGYLLPKTFLCSNKNDKLPDWLCNKCHLSLASYDAEELLDNIGKDLAEVPRGEARECKKFIEAYGQLLTPNHYYLTDVKFALSQLIGQEEGGLQNVSDEDLETKAHLCRGLSELALALIPGEKRLRGLLLFELHASFAEMGRRKTNPIVRHSSLMESRKILEEAIELLKFEPKTSPEGKIYQQALLNMKHLDAMIMTVHTSLGDNIM